MKQKSSTVKTLTRTDLVKALKAKVGISHESAIYIVEKFIDHSIRALQQENLLKLTGFGTFTVLKKAQRIGRNPRIKEKAIVSARKSVSFHPSTPLKNKVNSGLKNKE